MQSILVCLWKPCAQTIPGDSFACLKLWLTFFRSANLHEIHRSSVKFPTRHNLKVPTCGHTAFVCVLQ
jgi:hypothetical protein